MWACLGIIFATVNARKKKHKKNRHRGQQIRNALVFLVSCLWLLFFFFFFFFLSSSPPSKKTQFVSKDTSSIIIIDLSPFLYRNRCAFFFGADLIDQVKTPPLNNKHMVFLCVRTSLGILFTWTLFKCRFRDPLHSKRTFLH